MDSMILEASNSNIKKLLKINRAALRSLNFIS